ncbi:MAG: serine hydrolase, partial [Flavobacteriales bacterium]|nr:serine hydrolase [Flavobacteriales bacterium]
MRSLLILLFLSPCLIAATQISSKEIDVVVERALKAFDVPGIAVAVVKDGKVVHSKGYGLASLNTKKKVDKNTLFGIASNSKAFLTATIAMLVDEGKMDWDDKVTDHIPEFKLYDPYVTADFTIRDLLTHRSGMGLGAGDLMFFPAGNDFTLADIIHNLRYLKQTSPFRSKFDYDNLLYLVAGEVVTRVSGMSWEDFVEERIMKPLGMNRSAATLGRLVDKSNIIDGHVAFDEQKARVVPSHDLKIGEAAAAGIFSSVADLSKWMICRLNEGKYGKNGENRLFSEKNHIEMWKPHTNLAVRNDKYNSHFNSYALGWQVSDVKGYKQVTHTGGLEGMVTQVTLMPELNLGIVVLTNQQMGVAFVSVTNTIKDAYLGLEVEDWVLKYDTLMAKRSEKNGALEKKVWHDVDSAVTANKGKIDMATFTGKYVDPWLGEIEISDLDGQIWFQSKRSP